MTDLENQTNRGPARPEISRKRKASEASKELTGDALTEDFSCRCGRTFNRIENLVRHTKTHSTTRDWVCSTCSKAFTRSDLLKRHILTHASRDSDTFAETGGDATNDRAVDRERRDSAEDTEGSVPAVMASIEQGPRETRGSEEAETGQQDGGKRFQIGEAGPSSYYAREEHPIVKQAALPSYTPVEPYSFNGGSWESQIQTPINMHQPGRASPHTGLSGSSSANDLAELQILNGAGFLSTSVGGMSQPSSFDSHGMLDQRMVWDAMGLERSPQDALVWDNGMHWILDNPSAFGGDLHFQKDNFNSQYLTEPIPDGRWSTLDALQSDSTNFGVDPTLLSSLLQEFNPQQRQQRATNVLQNHIGREDSRGLSPKMAYSRAISPPADAVLEEDKWPTNWRPAGRAYRFGAGSAVTDVASAADIGEGLDRWRIYWIGEETFAKVKNCFALAATAPGAPIADFQMPRSIHTINHFISLYFEHFEAQLSILHAPTFKIAEASPLLIASFIMVGANYSDLKGARAFAVDLIEVLRKTLHALFDDDARNLRSVQIIHVYMLNMLTGLWCGNKRTYELAEASRGTLINLLRKAELLNSAAMAGPQRSTPQSGDVEQRWRQWAAAESRKRLGLAICLVDITFPALLDVPAYHSQGDMIKLALPADDRYWTARTARVWESMLGMSSCPPSPYFTSALSGILTPAHVSLEERIPPIPDLNDASALVAISSLHHHIYEFRTQLSMYLSAGLRVPLYYRGMSEEMGVGFEGRRDWLSGALELWRENYYDSKFISPQMEAARIFWHLGYVSLNVHITTLYIASGKRGKEMAQGVAPDIKAWAHTVDAPVAVRHALDLLTILRKSSRCSILYPTTAFVSCLCLWAYVRERTGDKGDEAQQNVMRDVQAFVLDSSGDSPAHREMPKPSHVLDRGARMLARGKAWRIGAAFALVLASCTEQDPDGHAQ